MLTKKISLGKSKSSTLLRSLVNKLRMHRSCSNFGDRCLWMTIRTGSTLQDIYRCCKMPWLTVPSTRLWVCGEKLGSRGASCPPCEAVSSFAMLCHDCWLWLATQNWETKKKADGIFEQSQSERFYFPAPEVADLWWSCQHVKRILEGALFLMQCDALAVESDMLVYVSLRLHLCLCLLLATPSISSSAACGSA